MQPPQNLGFRNRLSQLGAGLGGLCALAQNSQGP